MDPELNILLLSIGYPPRSVGGTEVYVQALARELELQGHRVTVVIPSEDKKSSSNELPDIHEMSLADFRDFLSTQRFDVVHAHPLTANQFLGYLQVCKEQEIPVIMTYHTPTLSCGRGDLLLYGREPCDGEMRQQRCTACILQQKGLPLFIGRILAVLPGLSIMESIIPVGKLRSMFSIPRQVRQNRNSFQQLRGLVCHWVAVSKWVKKVLEINGVPEGSITVCRQALCNEAIISDLEPESDFESEGRSLKIGFVGRIHPYKGLHILFKALRFLPTAKLEVHIVGDNSDIVPEYQRLLGEELCNDSRVKWIGKLEPHLVTDFLRRMDVLTVPSLWMETGPMTVLEAWAVGVPIIGTDRGGIKEWVDEYGGGWLFPAGDARALASIIENLLNKQISIPTVPTEARLFSMKIVARSMAHMYKDVVSQKNGLEKTVI